MLQQIADVRAAIKRREIIDLFSGSNEACRNPKFILDCDDDSAFTATVEFSDNQTSESYCTLEFARLAKRIAPSRCVDHQQPLVRRSGILFPKRALHFFQLGHEIRFCMHSAGRIADQKLDLALDRRLIRFVTKRSRICVVLPANHFNADPFGPNAELFDGRRAKCVGCRQQDTVSILLKITSEFRRGCCFSGAVYTQEQNYFWFGGLRLNGYWIFRQNAADFLAYDLYNVIDANK